jgi:hypothetical protein
MARTRFQAPQLSCQTDWFLDFHAALCINSPSKDLSQGIEGYFQLLDVPSAKHGKEGSEAATSKIQMHL